MNEVNQALDRLSSRLLSLETQVSELRLDCGEDCMSLGDNQRIHLGMKPLFPTRVSAMQAVHLLMSHLGLKFSFIPSKPARTELVQEEK